MPDDGDSAEDDLDRDPPDDEDEEPADDEQNEPEPAESESRRA
jgi:hypothetical protein